MTAPLRVSPALIAALLLAGAASASPRVMTVTTPSPQAREVFERGRGLADNNRQSEAIELFRQAIALDPQFALAYAYLGFQLEGPEAVELLERGAALSAPIPEPERVFIQMWLATRQGDTRKAAALARELMRLAPDEWRGPFELGQQALRQRDWELAVSAFRKATALNDRPHSCNGFNNLGYSYAMVGRYDQATATLQRCIDLDPREANPRDSLADVELAAGQLLEAEHNFAKATELAPNLAAPWHGWAAVLFRRQQWAEGYRVLDRARAALTGSEDRLEIDVTTAWALLAQGESERALKQIDSLERGAKAAKASGQYHYVVAALTRAAIFNALEQYAPAITAAKVAIERVSTAGLSGNVASAVTRRARVRQLWAEAKLGKIVDAAATLKRLEEDLRRAPELGEPQSALHFARGALLVARGELAAARDEYRQCQLTGISEWLPDFETKPEDPSCFWQLSLLEDRLGDHAAAAKTRAALARPSRDPVDLYLKRELDAAAAAPHR